MSYTVHVAFQQDDPAKDYGPFETYDEAFAYAAPFAEEGLDVEILSSVPICDFCSRHEIAWAYRAKDFVPEPTVAWGSRGSWGACQGCHELIEQDDYIGLMQRSLENFNFEEHGIPNIPAMRLLVMGQIRMMHATFRSVRLGPAIPAGEWDGR